MARHTRVTFYQDDDVTPIDGAGIITCSTDPAHARPYLRPVGEHAESEVNFTEGRSVIGQLNLTIQDNRRTASDQDTGWFTQLMRDPTSFDNRLMGRRCKVEEQATDGSYYSIFDGVVQSVRLNSDLVSYNVALRDIRERERRMRGFLLGNTSVIWPERGLSKDYGKLPAGSQRTHLIKATTVTASGVFKKIGDHYGYVTLNTPRKYKFDVRDADAGYVGKLFEYGSPDVVRDTTSAEFNKVVHPYCRVRWRVSGGAWTELVNMPRTVEGLRTPHGGFNGIWSFSSSNDGAIQEIQMRHVYLAGRALAEVPTNNQAVEIQVISNMSPNEFAPLHIEDTFGQLLKDIYDGVYSTNYDGNIRYNAAAMADLVTSTPMARCILTEPIEDVRAWTEENIYKPLGMAPAINEDGEIVPIKYELPDATVSLVTLNDNNTVAAEWEHGVDNAITKVVFKYKRDFLRHRTKGAETDLLRFATVDVTHEHIDAAAGIMGIRPVTYEPVTVRDVVDNETGYAQDANSEIGSALSRARSYGLLDRFRYGGQKMSLRCRRSDTGVAGLKVGDWVLVGVSWLPDYVTGERGANRLAQVVKIKSYDHTFRQLTLLDAGSSNTPLGQPTLGTVTQADGVVSVPITALPTGGEARVDYAIAAAQPSVSSGDWIFLGRTAALTTLRTPILPSGVTVWIRARGEGQGKRPSAWTNAVSIATAAVPRPVGLTVTVNSDNQAVIDILPNQHMLGARIYYVVYNEADTAPAYSAFVDASTPAGVGTSVTLTGAVVNQRQYVKIKVVGYPGFSAGSVTGTAGTDSEVTFFRDEANYPTLPVVKPVTSETATLGTLVLEITDPQKRVTKVEFATQVGTAAMSAYTEDTSAPYSVDVSLVEKQISQIAYKVWGYDELGVNKVLSQDIIPYHAGPKPAIPTIQSMSFDSAGALHVVVAGDSDTASLKAYAEVGTDPTLAEIRTATPVDGRAGTFTFTGPYAVGAEVHVGVLGYGGTGATGLESETAGFGMLVRPRSGVGSDASAPKAFITPDAESETTMSLSYSGAVGTGGTGPLEYRRRIDIEGVEGTWSAYAAFPLGGGTYAEEVITKSKKYTKEVVLQTRDAAGVESDYAHWTVYGHNESVAPITGRLKPTVPMDTTGWLPFGRGGDTAADVVMTSARYFVNSDQIDGADLRVVNIKRGAVNAESSANLFKRAESTAADVVETTAQKFTHSDQLNATTRRINYVDRAGVTTEPTTNLLKIVTDAVYPSQFQAGFVDVVLTFRSQPAFQTLVRSTGGSAGFEFQDRADLVTEWLWYATGGTARLTMEGVGDRLAVTSSGGTLYGQTWSLQGSAAEAELMLYVASVMRGRVYATSGNLVGFLDANAAWRVQASTSGGTLFGGWTIDRGGSGPYLHLTNGATTQAYLGQSETLSGNAGYVELWTPPSGKPIRIAVANVARADFTTSGGTLFGAWGVEQPGAAGYNDSLVLRTTSTGDVWPALILQGVRGGFTHRGRWLIDGAGDSARTDFVFQTYDSAGSYQNRFSVSGGGGGTLYGNWAVDNGTLDITRSGSNTFRQYVDSGTFYIRDVTYGSTRMSIAQNDGVGALYGALWKMNGNTVEMDLAFYWNSAYRGSFFSNSNGIGILDNAGAWGVRVSVGGGGTMYGAWSVTDKLTFTTNSRGIWWNEGSRLLANGAATIDFLANSTTAARIQLKTTGDGLLGALHGETSAFGLLNNSGGWAVQCLNAGGNLHGTWSLYNAGTPRLIAAVIPVTAFDNALTAPEGTFQAVYTP